MAGELPIKKEDAIAFFRLQVISELLEAEPGFVKSTAKKLADKKFNDIVNKRMVGFSVRTLFYYYSNYKKYGFDGLKPKIRCDKGTHPSIPNDIIQYIIELKNELPSRSATKIIIMLTLARKIEEGMLNERTVNRILNQYGYTRESLTKDNRIYVKHEKEQINLMWQSDIMSAFYIPDGSGEKKLAYLIGIIDDHSRRDMHSEFYFDSTLTRLEDTLRKSVIKFGAPSSLYIDNGKVYISEQFKLICARLGIRLKYSTPYHPCGKGKIERFWNTVQDSFLPEVKNQHVKSLSELNDLYFAWKKVEYDNKLHTSISTTPIERWNQSVKSGVKLNYPSPLEIEDIFLHASERTVDKYGCISFEGNKYEVSAELVGKKIILRYNPFHLDFVHVYFNDKYFGTAKIIDLATQRHKDVGLIPETSGYDSEISKLYFQNIQADYQKYLEQQLQNIIDSSIVKTSSDKDIAIPEEPHPLKPPKDADISIERTEFLDIVKNSLGISQLTYQEKGKLNELWETFKDFNRDILISILEDLKLKTNDFNCNFIYYIAQIRTMYIDSLSNAKEVK